MQRQLTALNDSALHSLLFSSGMQAKYEGSNCQVSKKIGSPGAESGPKGLGLLLSSAPGWAFNPGLFQALGVDTCYMVDKEWHHAAPIRGLSWIAMPNRKYSAKINLALHSQMLVFNMQR